MSPERERTIPAPRSIPEIAAVLGRGGRGQAARQALRRVRRARITIRAPSAPSAAATAPSGRRPSGRGTIYSYSVMRRVPVPYAIAYVTLDEGVTMMTNIVDCDLDAHPDRPAGARRVQADRRRPARPDVHPPVALRRGTLPARHRHRRDVHRLQPPGRENRRALELQVADRAGRSGPGRPRRLSRPRGGAGVRPGGARLPGPRRDDRHQHRHPAQRRLAGAPGHRGLRRRARDPAAPAREPGELHGHAPAAAHPALPRGRGDRAHPDRRHRRHPARPRRSSCARRPGSSSGRAPRRSSSRSSTPTAPPRTRRKRARSWRSASPGSTSRARTRSGPRSASTSARWWPS